jgi:hypothetical protein
MGGKLSATDGRGLQQHGEHRLGQPIAARTQLVSLNRNCRCIPISNIKNKSSNTLLINENFGYETTWELVAN